MKQRPRIYYIDDIGAPKINCRHSLIPITPLNAHLNRSSASIEKSDTVMSRASPLFITNQAIPMKLPSAMRPRTVPLAFRRPFFALLSVLRTSNVYQANHGVNFDF